MNTEFSNITGVILLSLWNMCDICSTLIVKTPERHQWHCSCAIIANFEHIWQMIYWFYFQLPTFQVFLTLNKYWTAAFLTLSVLIATLTVFLSFLSVPMNTSANSPLPRRLPICKYRLSSSFAKSWTASSTAWYVVGSRYNCFPTLQNLFPKLTTRIMKSYTRKIIKFSHSHKTIKLTKTSFSQKRRTLYAISRYISFSQIFHCPSQLLVLLTILKNKYCIYSETTTGVCFAKQ